MEVIILAGGKGTRLREVIGEMPKPMALVNGVPFLQRQLDWLVGFGASHFILSVGYCRDVIINYFGDSYNGVKISYAVEDKPLGTGGAISLASKFAENANFFILNGDTFYPIDLEKMESNCTGTDIAMAIRYMKVADRYGLVQVKESKIIGFQEKMLGSEGMINAGIYYVSKEFTTLLPEGIFSFESYLQDYVNKKEILTYQTNEDILFIDIGVPEDYKLANKLIS